MKFVHLDMARQALVRTHGNGDPVVQCLEDHGRGGGKLEPIEHHHGGVAALDILVVDEFGRGGNGGRGVGVRDRPQRQVSGLRRPFRDRLVSRGIVGQERLDLLQRLVHDLGADRIPLEAEPDVGRAHDRAETREVIFADDPQHPAKRFGLGLIDDFQID